MEYGRFILLVVAAIGWLFAALIAFVIVTLFGFFGVGFLGLLIWFICMQVELEAEGGASLFAARVQVRQDMSHAERASRRHEQSLGIGTTRFFRNVGIGLVLVGFGGFLYFQLGPFAS